MGDILLPPSMVHVERKELYLNFSSRLQYLHTFLGWGQVDIEALLAAQPLVKSLIPAVSEAVYNKLLEQDITAQALVVQSTRNNCTLDADDFYDSRSQNVKNRHMFVRWYLTKLNSDPRKPQYWEYLNKVGAMHNGHYRRQALHIDVIHFSMMLGHVQGLLNEAIISHPSLTAAQKVSTVNAFSKVLWIQNDLFTKWHVRDGDEYDMLSPGATKLEWDRAMDSSSESDTSTLAEVSGCPFAGLSRMASVSSEVNGAVKKAKGYVYGIGSIQSIVDPTQLSALLDPFARDE